MSTRKSNTSCNRLARAFSLAEVAVSVVLVGTVLVAALNMAGTAVVGRRRIGDRARGHLLAQQLMAEILRQRYAEPDDTPIFGREPAESGGGRSFYDDVDDYDGWEAAPPERKDRTVIAGLGEWSRAVSVAWVDPNDHSIVLVADSGVKVITVTVSRNGALKAELTAIRTAAADLIAPPPGLPPGGGGP